MATTAGLVLTAMVAAACSAPVSGDGARIAEAGEIGPSGSADTAGRPQPQQTVHLVFAGDSNADGPLAYRLSSRIEPFVGSFAPVFKRADLAMLNLETAITDATTPEPKAFTFHTDPSILPALKDSGIDVVSMANNHGMDYGWDGLKDSLAAKAQSQGPVIIGIGRDETEAYAPHIVDVKDSKIAVFTATQVLDENLMDKWTAGPNKGGLASAKRVDYLTERIRGARPDVDTVVVFLHYGTETYTCPTQDQIDLVKKLRRAGADIIVGGHQHRLAGGGRLGDAFVHYGMGNFLFQAASPEAARTGVLELDVRGRQIEDYRWLPGRISNGVPQPLSGADKNNELAYWESLRSCTNLQK